LHTYNYSLISFRHLSCNYLGTVVQVFVHPADFFVTTETESSRFFSWKLDYIVHVLQQSRNGFQKNFSFGCRDRNAWWRVFPAAISY